MLSIGCSARLRKHRRSDDRTSRDVAGDRQQSAEAERDRLDEQAEEPARRGQLAAGELRAGSCWRARAGGDRAAARPSRRSCRGPSRSCHGPRSPAANCAAAAMAEVATSSFFCVARWLNQASVTRRIDATTASIPIQKWSRNAVKQEDRRPRRVEHRGHGRRRNGRADEVEIAHGLACGGRSPWPSSA